ncbi:MAG TPA: alpha/beta hydrolase [Ktedonobacterales bacterium]|nr:alpha/beta hydrolase [Ktedonobacterales bacterium]
MTDSTHDPRTTATRSGHTIVFLHGSGDSAKTWDAVIERLPGYDCLALSLPGHGDRLDRPGPGAMSVADYAAAVHAAFARRELEGVTLVGHSLGSAIALWMALEYPSRVGRVVLVGAGARLRVLPALLESAVTDQAATQHELLHIGFAPGHEAAAEAYTAALAPVASGVLGRDLAACDAFDVMADLGRIDQPALIVVGEHDRLTPPKYATYLRDHLDRATLVTVPDAGHFVQAEAPDVLAAAIRDWLG